MRPGVHDEVLQILRDLDPTLVSAFGFSVSLIEWSDDGQRIRLGYNEPVDDIPLILVSAIAAVTRTGVDFVHPGTVSIASFVQHVKSKPTKSIEELLIEHDI